MSDPLKDYKNKRDFDETPEPEGVLTESDGMPVFVIQKHAARNLHYDLRLESKGVMKSWAVPKGPSMDPKVKRLAVPTEDHPMNYNDFEGIIPEGNYGAGTVIIWDRGTFKNAKGEEESFADNIEEGHATIDLNGEKLKGKFAILRTNRGGKRLQWLFFKMKDAHADPGSDILTDKPNSVKTGRSLEEVAEQEQSSKMDGFQ